MLGDKVRQIHLSKVDAGHVAPNSKLLDGISAKLNDWFLAFSSPLRKMNGRPVIKPYAAS